MGSVSEAATKTTVNLLLGGAASSSPYVTTPAGTGPAVAIGGGIGMAVAMTTLTPDLPVPIDENQLFDIDSTTVAFALTVLMSIGIGLNCVLLLIVLLHPRVRQLVNAFVGHYAAISVLKCIFCIVFATSLTTRFEAALCDKIGGSYVVLTSVEVFNLLAMVCAEAYFFGQANVGRDGRGSCCCVMIGLFLIYLGSVILHLGPTIIAGGIGFNRTAGSCIFGYKSIQSYVAHAIWIVITTLGITAVLYYLSVVYREVQSCRPHRIASLVRASVPTTTRGQQTVDHLTVKRIVSDSQRRAVVLILVTCTFVVTSYPLFLLTLFDIGFSIEGSMYRVFTFISWTNTLINPILFLLVDRKFGLIRLLKPCNRATARGSTDSSPSRRPSQPAPTYLIGSSSSTSALKSGSITAATTTAPTASAMTSSASVPGAGVAVSERTGLLSKSTDRLPNYELREEEDMTLGCGGGGHGASSKSSMKQSAAVQPPALNEWQSRVGGRLYLQGELIGADAADDSFMLVNGPGTVILYDRPTTTVASQQQYHQRSSAERPMLVSSGLASNFNNSSDFSQIMQQAQMTSGLSNQSLAATTPTTPGGGRRTYFIRSGNQPDVVDGYGNTGVMVGSGSRVNTVLSTSSQQLFGGTNKEYIGPVTLSPSAVHPYHQQQQQQPPSASSSVHRIYRPHSAASPHHQQQSSNVEIFDAQHIASTASPQTMMLLATQRQLHHQQQQQMQQSQLPTLRVVTNSSNNISLRQLRPPMTTTASFIGTEDSLEEIVYANTNPNISHYMTGGRDRLDDDETTC